MRALLLPPEMQQAVAWLRAIGAQSWRAPQPPPWPARPTVNPEAMAFWDFLNPIYARTVAVYAKLQPITTTAPYVPNPADYGGGAP